ncbi:MAG: hypothetical protein ACRBB0_16615 [Pelagimonas sp.]|uniref:hypothetical protein n=1 Tax=Pelagimonas sp. TaxID=2073170 RepID=UPI003D6A2F62
MELFLLDNALRGASSGIFLLFAILIWTARITREAQLAFTATAITISARLWSTLPPGFELPDTATHFLRLIGTGASL